LSAHAPVHAPNLQVVDLARTLAILPVLALHFTGRWFAPDQEVSNAWYHLSRNGAYGVSIFFMISGFLITRILDRDPGGAFKARWKKFYAHRVGRIVPLLALDILLGILLWRAVPKEVLGFGYSFNLPQNPLDPTFWLPLLGFTFNWARAYWSLNLWGGIGVHWGVLWSLAVEEQFYFFYPLILRILKNPRRLVFFLFSLTMAALGWRWFVMGQPMDNGLDWKWGSFGYFDQIGLGIGLYFLQKHTGAELSARPFWAGLLVLMGLAGFGADYWMTFCVAKPDVLFAPSLAAAALALALWGGLNLPFFESKHFWLLSLPGKYSYGNYLFHGMVLFAVVPLLGRWNLYAAFLGFLTASTLLAALSFHFFEAPANRWVRKKLKAA
jgi:peptidoglycan/LPS O-acetylase OafA/YrhL